MSTSQFPGSPSPLKMVMPALIGFGILLIAILLFNSYVKVPAGHVAVATLFGDIRPTPYEEGLHIVNPLYEWHMYDGRQKSHLETAQVPSQDQLQTKIDVSVQYRIIKSRVARDEQVRYIEEDAVIKDLILLAGELQDKSFAAIVLHTTRASSQQRP